MTVDPKVLDAQNRVEIQRAKLMRSVEYGIGQAKRRLAPDLIAAQAWDATKAKVSDTAHEAVVAAKSVKAPQNTPSIWSSVFGPI